MKWEEQTVGPDVTISLIDDVDVVGHEWRLLEAEVRPSIFLSWLWIGTWLRTISCDAYLAKVMHQGQVVGLGILCPFRQVRHRVMPVRQFHLNGTGDPGEDVITLEYNGLLCHAADARRLLGVVLDAAMTSRIPNSPFCAVDEIVLANINSRICEDLQAEGYLLHDYAIAPSFFVDLAALREAKSSLLSALSKNSRYQIRRSVRLYEESAPLIVERAATRGQAFEFLAELRSLHQATWEGRGHEGAFAHSFFETFHSRMISAGVESGHIDLVKVAVGDQVIGYLYNFIYGKIVYYYTSGFAYTSDHKYKPGLVCHFKCVEYYQERGLDVYDFMAGASQYKSSLGQPGPVLWSVAVQRQQFKLRLEAKLRRQKNKWKLRLEDLRQRMLGRFDRSSKD